MTEAPSVIVNRTVPMDVAAVAPVVAPAAPPTTSATIALPLGTVIDATGRRITVKPLDPLQVYRLAKIMGQAADSDFARGYAALAACVREIDGVPEPFPNNDREIEAMMQRLGGEGLDAVNEALAAVNAEKAKNAREAAKN